MIKQSTHIWKLGMFVIGAIVVFAATIFFIGKQKNLFGSTFRIHAYFKNVSGLSVGNNIRFSGINIGTVDEIQLVSDSTVVVSMTIEKEVQKFIKIDAKASIGSDGLMGDKVLTISPGTHSQKMISENGRIGSVAAIEMDDIMRSAQVTMENASVITQELAQFTYDMNNGKGTISRLMTDEKMANSLDKTMTNLQKSTKGLNENMEAAKHNFLLRGYFKKKEKEEQKKKEELEKAKQEANESKKNK
ncbi:MAG: MlaD family protein [Flavobacteriaceae bacterium]|uniref:MCE family protein n=1 Tax=Flavobacterium kayseriense TaxID=2764714 RepID=A0ABR7JB87_9FLAO|nr:MlaD family protein [Flavobacterium kayseriense]MBC5842786.1 MCE family protein [Flavobacterium kayseriense]MBC5849316.1 MCE family protein [Flavobacterium kayseriense]MBX9887118.1 MlaD family protein [Flavobacteriaceae bacterium]